MSVTNTGDVIGSYRVVSRLGRGGMGEVFEVEHTESGEHFALKAFTLDHGNREFLRKRFRAEAKILSRLDHPRLVKVRELAIDDDGEMPYFVMDLVLNENGTPETLEDVRKSGRVTEKAALKWYEDLRQGIEYIHSQGVVHRDVKLENVLIDSDGNAVLSDFGVSRIFDEKVRSELMVTTTFVTGETTGTRPVMGTYWYIAPEIRRGGEATPASDWYALGVLMYRLLTGMWYEPGTNAFDLLAPFSKECQRIVRRLLSDAPDERCPRLTVPDAPSRRGAGRFLIAIALSGVIVLTFCLWHLTPPPPLLSSSSSDSLSFHYSEGVDFTFRRCPAGTNMLGGISIAVTRPYWLAEIPVTWRQWRAVRSEEHESGWNGEGGAPATYLTYDEASSYCARLTRRFAKELPEGYEIRLPTVAEWRLAYQVGNTVTNRNDGDTYSAKLSRCEIGWFGQGPNGMPETSNMKRYFEDRNMKVRLVSETWPDFPPRQMHAKGSSWIGNSSRFVPVPAKLKPANELGLYDMCGNCFEMCYDCVDTNNVSVFFSEYGFKVGNVYPGMGSSLSDPFGMTGPMPTMVGSYLTPSHSGDDVWAAPFDRLPHLGFRLCIGPILN